MPSAELHGFVVLSDCRSFLLVIRRRMVVKRYSDMPLFARSSQQSYIDVVITLTADRNAVSAAFHEYRIKEKHSCENMTT